ncbi:MAG: hypothetical protein K1X28_00625 [Parachlamydiales bacterium]|nr:hypothetical protein [Parachlamydiales bacterium]
MSSVNLGAVDQQNIDLTRIEDQPGAPGYIEPVVEADAVEVSAPTQKFEWNVERLFVHDPKHSMARTWFVRILSLIVGIPVLLLDLGRRLAFSVGLVNGKSWSLIDKTADACQAISDKVSGVYSSIMGTKELSLEEQNASSKQRIHAQAARMIEGYNKLNGGYFHTNSSFSSPYALSGEKQVHDAKLKLVEEVNAFVARNATSPEDFSATLDTAKGMVWSSIVEAAKDDFYIANKIERIGEPDLLRDVAFNEFLDSMNKNVLAEQFVEVASRNDQFAAGLKKGVETAVLTESQAKQALVVQAQQVYAQGLQTGVQEAERAVTHLLDSGIKEKIVTRNEAVAINQGIQPEVETLALAAAKDLARANTPDNQVKVKLVKVSKDLQNAKRLKPENVSQFLTSAEAHVARVRDALQADQQRAQEEANRVEAQRVAAVQKAADQQSLLGQFEGMLGLIARKQSQLTGQFLKYDEMDNARREIGEQLENIRNAKVVIRGQEITVLEAAAEYYAAVSLISRSNLTAVQRKQQMDALRGQGFTQTTVDRIKALEALEPRLTQLIDDQERLANEIEAQHNEIVRLRAVYNVFRRNNFGGLEQANRRSIVDREVVINRTQKTLNDRHALLIGRTGIIARLRIDEPSVPVNIDPVGNRQEVAALVEEFERMQGASAPALVEPRSTARKIFDGVTYPVRAPLGLIYRGIRKVTG